MEEHGSQEITLRDILRVLFRYKLVSIVITITLMISVYIVMELRTPLYQSDVKMLVAGSMQKDVEVERSLGPGSLIATQMEMVRSKPIIERTVRSLKLDQRPVDYEKRFATPLKAALIERSTRELKQQLELMTPEQRKAFKVQYAMQALAGRISTYPMGETSMFLIRVRDYSPQAAAMIANVISRSYVIFDLEQQIAELQLIYGRKNETIRKLENYIAMIEETLDGRILPDIEAIGPATVKIVSQAGAGSRVSMKPSKSAAYMIGFLLSMVISAVVAYGFDYFDHTIKTHQELQKFLGIPFLGAIPKRKGKDDLIITHTNPATRYIQAYQNLSNRVYLIMKERNLKSVIMADAEGADESAALAANIGILIANKSHRRVLIIDSDLRSSRITAVFNLNDRAGLANVLEGEVDFINTVLDLGYNLSILPAGKSDGNPVSLLDSPGMYSLMNEAREQFEMVFIYGPDIKNYTDVAMMSSVADSFILILNEGQVKRQIIKHAIEPIEEKEIDMTGAIINNRRYVIPEIIYRFT